MRMWCQLYRETNAAARRSARWSVNVGKTAPRPDIDRKVALMFATSLRVNQDDVPVRELVQASRDGVVEAAPLFVEYRPVDRLKRVCAGTGRVDDAPRPRDIYQPRTPVVAGAAPPERPERRSTEDERKQGILPIDLPCPDRAAREWQAHREQIHAVPFRQMDPVI